MTEAHKPSWRWLLKKLTAQFLAGIIIIVPIGITILILVWIFNAVDGVLQPIVRAIWGQTIPGVGFGAMIVLIYLAGLIANNVIGKQLIHWGESVLAKIPGFRLLYSGIKQILESFASPNKSGFLDVVLVEFPRKGMRSIGFVTNQAYNESGEKLLNVFIPTAPTPTSGFLQIMKESEVIRTKLSVDEALKMVVSVGRMAPKEVGDKLYPEA